MFSLISGSFASGVTGTAEDTSTLGFTSDSFEFYLKILEPKVGLSYVVSDSCRLIRRTIWRVFRGEGRSMISYAMASVSKPSSFAISSNSFSCSSAF